MTEPNGGTGQGAAGNQTGGQQQQGGQNAPQQQQGGQPSGGEPGAGQPPTRTQGLVDDHGEPGASQGQETGGLTQTQLDQITQRFQSEMDRRVNQALGPQGKNTNSKKTQQEPQQEPDTRREDLREARAVYRDYVGDQVQFLSPDEREYAQDLAQGLLPGRLDAGDDPDAAGRVVARDVADKTRRLRAMYEQRTVEALRRRGALNEPAQQSDTGSTQPGGESTYQKGQEMAQHMFGDRKTGEQ